MAWVGKQHPVEMLAEWAAPLLLAAAAVWAASAAGLPVAAKAAGGLMALSVGIVAMRMAGAAPLSGEAPFHPAVFDGEEDVLLLEDRLTEPAADSRVVHLFAAQETTPGELVLRISDYLSGQGMPTMAPSEADRPPADASQALHAALANIRATLR